MNYCVILIRRQSLFRTSFSLLIALFMQIFLISMASAFIAIWVDAISIVQSVMMVTLIWLAYLMMSDFIFFHLFRVARARFDSDLSLVFKSFSFRNRERQFQVYSSAISPVFMRISLLKANKFIVNESALKDFELNEVKAYLDLELSYSSTLGSFVEVLMQRFYIVTWVPIRALFTVLFGKVVADYLVGPLTLLYTSVIKMCRSEFNYDGKFVATLPQILFKVKILDKENGKIPLFNYAELCSNLMIKVGDDSMARFDPDELFR